MRRYVTVIVSIALLSSAFAGSLAYASATVGPVATRQTVVSTTPTPNTGEMAGRAAATGARYVAMGDSVAAGAGLPPLANATNNDEVCDRSAQAYPYLIAARLQTNVVHTACSGAKVDEGMYGKQERQSTVIPPQITTAFAGGTPSVFTVTVGANDVRWNQFIRQCYVTRCGFALDDARMKVYRADLRIELTRLFMQMKAKSQGSPPQVYISGYYSPVASTNCLASERITTTEAAWLTQQAANLNQAIRSVVPLFPFVTYVPLDFTGHEVCSSDPWVQGLDAEAPIHPTAAGQTAIANAFLTLMVR